MNPFALHVASGNALFSGTALAAVAFALECQRPGWARLIVWILWLMALALIVCSATPLAPIVWAAWGTEFFFWIIVRRSLARPDAAKSARGAKSPVVFLMIVTTLAINLGEGATLRLPRIDMSGQPVFVIGDSLSVPLEKGAEDCWPEQLRREFGWNITNCAEAGATSKSALEQARHLGAQRGLVILEIGGNDLFSGVSASEFESRLRALLCEVLQHGRTAVMLELPLPPFCNGYGRVQRRLATEFRIPLVTKRVFASVLSGQGATIDGLHLSNAGHAEMARQLNAILCPGPPRRESEHEA